jgi:hypothetical protein
LPPHRWHTLMGFRHSDTRYAARKITANTAMPPITPGASRALAGVMAAALDRALVGQDPATLSPSLAGKPSWYAGAPPEPASLWLTDRIRRGFTPGSLRNPLRTAPGRELARACLAAGLL